MYYNHLPHFIFAFWTVLIYLHLQELETIENPGLNLWASNSKQPDLKQSLKDFADLKPSNFSNKIFKDRPSLTSSCKLSKFGYSDKQAQSLFPLKEFKKCPKNQNFLIDSSKNVWIRCLRKEGNESLGAGDGQGLDEDGQLVAFALGVDEEEFGNIEFKGELKAGVRNFSASGLEYFFLRCGEDVDAFLQVVERQEVVERVEKAQEEIRGKVGKGLKPLAVHVVMFDSLSRQGFFRNFPKTAEFLNSTGRDLKVFDFNLAVAHGADTQPNLIPILYGHSSGEHWDKLRGLSIFKDSDHTQYLKIQEQIIWNYYKKLGFVTMFSYDTVWDYFSYTIGRKISTDHINSNFFHAAKKFSDYQDFKPDVQCVGNDTSDYYSLKYLLDFSKSYKNLNKFSYSHLSQGHESTGQVIRTVDQNLERTLKSIIHNYSMQSQDFVIFIAGDHGKHSKEWDLSYEGILENRLPLWLTLSNTEFLNRIDSKLHLNTDKLVSRLDFHLTLKHLATSPYGRLDPQSSTYKIWKKEVGLNAKSVLIEEVEDRTCEQTGIVEEFCPCEGFFTNEDVDEKYLKEILNAATEVLHDETNGAWKCFSVDKVKISKAMVRKIKEDRFLTRFVLIGVDGDGDCFGLEVVAYLTSLQEMARLKRKSFEVKYYGFSASFFIFSIRKGEDYLIKAEN